MIPPQVYPGDEPVDPSAPALLYHLAYCSRAAAGVDSAVVDRIVDVARRGNAVRDITGLLVFGGGLFFQCLEGRREQVLELMALIEQDERHHDVVVLDSGEELRERLFSGWDMERVDPEHVHTVLLDALGTVRDAASAQALRGMLTLLDSAPLAEIGRV